MIKANPQNSLSAQRDKLIFGKGALAACSFMAGLILTVMIPSLLIRSKYWQIAVIAATAAGFYIFCFILCRQIKKQVDILNSGLSGENRGVQLLRDLPANYTVVSDLNLQHNGYKSQIDHCVIGPNGIFLIETKNVAGMVSGERNSVNLTQSRRLKGGKMQKKEIYNPLKQTTGHARTVENILKEEGIHTSIHPMVYFSNSYIRLNVNFHRGDAFVPSKSAEMLKYIQKCKCEKPLTPQQQETARKALLRYHQK
ncbi:MAG: nuclease-related domain-containing protein [Oscillospiraceae bacterium]|nr:nuclease-related domain-containing protein [Oscillospiraceae bacterium]